MADEYSTSTNNRWDSSRNRFDTTGSSSSTTSSSTSSSSGLNGLSNFSWQSEMVDVKTGRSSIESAPVSDTCVAFHDKLQLAHQDCSSEFHMMNLGLSSQTIDWNQALLRGVKNESSFRSMLEDNMCSSTNYHHQQQQESGGIFSDSSMNQRIFSLDQAQFSPHGNAADSTVTCQGFQIDSSSIYGNASTMLQGLLGSDNQSLENNRLTIYHNYGPNCGFNCNDLVPSWSKVPQFLRNSPPKQNPHSQLHFSNNASFWNASARSMNAVRPGFLSSQLPAASFDEKPKNISEVQDSGEVMKKSGSEQPTKRPRNETASPIPAFKVRKEKMGDRITALQQLVSPFGKTDTASVLSEAIEYIKFLHAQVTVLSTPYMKSGATIQHQQCCTDNSKEEETHKQDLRSRGLCLVPVSSTFPVTYETTVDFWTPTFGGTYI